ncbi:HNH endonuclease [Pseudoxanthomonas sp. Root630]|uniref:HNH endonuclease n=1 Tax=Pseudoxanthomonas sp. Root630 TaxID=1736574 RepID=UPI0007024600|nr:HNH endonuclease [Pseudoxanthomonas sp. Root630]KRA44369.1 hypothetical protein ASD72_10195 [Pseudoxanthomonas sp. Root630]
MDKNEEAKFEAVLHDAILKAKEKGYHPNRFIGMIASKGAFRTVKDIVASGKPSEGFNTLVLANSVELTCEAIIVETEWRRFFDDDLLEIAEKRLSQFGYAWKKHQDEVLLQAAPPPDAERGPGAEQGDDFIPPDADHRQRQLREPYSRPGQVNFRRMLISMHGPYCMLTQTDVEEALEAAHICAYMGEQSDHPLNGLLLRRDIHSLFDRYMLSIHPETLQVCLSERLRSSKTYRDLDGKILNVDANGKGPSRKALRVHFDTFTRDNL